MKFGDFFWEVFYSYCLTRSNPWESPRQSRGFTYLIIIATDNEGNIVVFNPTAEKIFGYSQEEAKSTKKAKDVYPEKIMQKIADVFSGKKDKGDDIFTEEHTSVAGKNGEPVPVRISGAILYEANKPIGSVGFFQDLREIKELREEFLPEHA